LYHILALTTVDLPSTASFHLALLEKKTDSFAFKSVVAVVQHHFRIIFQFTNVSNPKCSPKDTWIMHKN